MWKAKIRMIGLGLFFVLLLGIAGCGSSSPASSSTEENKETEAAAQDQPVEEEAATTSEAATESVNAETTTQEPQSVDCSFILDGKRYTLPADYSAFEADGWKTAADLNKELGGMTYTTLQMTKEGKEQDYLYFYFYNGSGNKAKLKDCQVAGVEVSKKNLDSFPFELANGIKPGDDKETVEKIMGTPTKESDSDKYFSVYYGEDREFGQIQFVWWKDSKNKEELNDKITICHFKRIETSTYNTGADYLKEYKAPTMLGSDFNSGTISLDKVVYQLPCPMSEFEKNGWALTKHISVMAGRNEYGYMEKKGVKVNIGLSNYADIQMDGRNCAVSQIEVDNNSDSASTPEVVMPKNITFKSTLQQLNTAVQTSSLKFAENKADDNSYVSYNCDDYDLGIHVKFFFDNEKGKIVNISLKKDQWSN